MPAWTYSMITKIIESDFAEITLVIQNNIAPSEKPKKSLLFKIKNYIASFLFRFYTKKENKKYKSNNNAFQEKDLNQILKGIDILKVTPKSTLLSDRILEEDLSKIGKYNLDVMIRLGFKILRGDILTTSKYGIWSFHHGDNKLNRGGPAGTWEVMEGWEETGVVLQILTEDLDGGVVIERSTSCTVNNSIISNKNNYYWKALSMIPRNLRKLHVLGGDVFMKQILHSNSDPCFYYNRLYLKPTNTEVLKYLRNKYSWKIKNKINKWIYTNQWILLYSFNKSNNFALSFFRFKKIIPPKDRFWADPFIVHKDNQYFVFIEELLYSNNKGHISYFTIDEKDGMTKPVKILEKNYHLSYPFIFEDNGSYYMIPETSENNTIELYKCTEFPEKWELQETLMANIKAVDATLLFYDNKYWLFCNVKENNGASTCDELFLFYSNKLLNGNWQSHRQNPIVSDVKKSRPAGKIFMYNNEFYRPSQNCSLHYGRGMHIAKILILNEMEYKEESIQFIYPNWDKNLIGTHTLNFDGKLTFIDGLLKRKK